MYLSIIVPAYNEEARIGAMLGEYLPYFTEKYGKEVEVLVVINGTTDSTEAVVRRLETDFPCLRCMVEPRKVGKGGAIIRGFGAAEGEVSGYVDADGATPPRAFDALVESLEDADLAIASRWCKGAQVSPKQPMLRLVMSRIFNLMTRMLFGLPFSDTQCGAKVGKKQAFAEVIPEIGITRWAFDVDLLFGFKRLGKTIMEIPTTWQDVGGSKITVTESSLEMVAALIRLRLIHSPFKWVVALYNRHLRRVLPYHSS